LEYSFKKVKIVDIPDVYDRYWEGLEEGVFRLTRCSGCKDWLWPLFERCGTCGSWDHDWVEVEPAGIIDTWTRVWNAFGGVEERAGDIPYVVVRVAIGSEDGPLVTGTLTGSEDGLRIGLPVRGEIEPPSPKTKGYASVTWSIVR
jgi:uncharacterized OB-fold protein